jgi:hypothetical protein
VEVKNRKGRVIQYVEISYGGKIERKHTDKGQCSAHIERGGWEGRVGNSSLFTWKWPGLTSLHCLSVSICKLNCA